VAQLALCELYQVQQNIQKPIGEYDIAKIRYCKKYIDQTIWSVSIEAKL